jgi:hypothetical protein
LVVVSPRFRASLARHKGRRLEEDDDAEAGSEDDQGLCAPLEAPGAQVLLLIGGVLYMFIALAVVCDEFFVPSLEVHGLGLSLHCRQRDESQTALPNTTALRLPRNDQFHKRPSRL